MKSLMQTIESLRILFIRSNIQTRTALILCTLLLSVGVGLLVQNANFLSNRMEYLFDGQDFTPQQLDQFELALSSSGLGHYERVGNRVRIPTASKDSYLKALAQAKCLPIHSQPQNDTSNDPLRLLEPRTAAEQRERKERIRQIESTLKEFPFVRQAVVTYDEKTDGFAIDKKRAATVAIRPKIKPSLTRSERRSIIRLVHMHFPGLKASEVVLVDLGLGETFTEPTLDSDPFGHFAQADCRWTDLRREHEEEIRIKALELLAGYGDVQILVYSEPFGLEQPIESRTASETQNNSAASPNAPSTIPNRKARLHESPAPTEILNAPSLYTNRISVSIPVSYYKRASAHSQHPLQEIQSQTAKAIREKLAPLAALPNSTHPNTQIEERIIVTDHIDSIDTATSQVEPWQVLFDWVVDSWKTLCLFGLILIAMLLLRSLGATRESKKETNGSSQLDLRDPPPTIQQDKPLAKPSMTLSKKIQSQPDQVALRLATWISRN
jgi:hypothetical protein